MQAYCGFKDLKCSVLDQLQALNYYINENLISESFANMTLNDIPNYITALGLTCESKVLKSTESFTTEDIQKIYTALNMGKYVLLTIPRKKGDVGYGHAVLAYGITNDGRLFIADSANVGSWNGDKGGKKYKMPLKQLIYSDSGCYSAYYIIGDNNAVPSQLSALNTELENCLEGS